MTMIRNWGKLSSETFELVMNTNVQLMRVIRDGTCVIP